MNPERVDMLVGKAVGGDADAMGALLGEFGPAVEAALHIGRRWRNLLDVADVMQVTYLEAFIQIGRFDRTSGTFLRWLRTIAANNLRDAIRGLGGGNRPPAERRLALDSESGSYAGLVDLIGATTTTPSRVAGQGEIRSIVDGAVNRLPADYRDVIRHYDLEGRSIAEVAVAMGRSAGAVHMLRARAHDHLKTVLGTESQFFGARA